MLRGASNCSRRRPMRYSLRRRRASSLWATDAPRGGGDGIAVEREFHNHVFRRTVALSGPDGFGFVNGRDGA